MKYNMKKRLPFLVQHICIGCLAIIFLFVNIIVVKDVLLTTINAIITISSNILVTIELTIYFIKKE